MSECKGNGWLRGFFFLLSQSALLLDMAHMIDLILFLFYMNISVTGNYVPSFQRDILTSYKATYLFD